MPKGLVHCTATMTWACSGHSDSSQPTKEVARRLGVGLGTRLLQRISVCSNFKFGHRGLPGAS